MIDSAIPACHDFQRTNWLDIVIDLAASTEIFYDDSAELTYLRILIAYPRRINNPLRLGY
jgi:hypothetical protein